MIWAKKDMEEFESNDVVVAVHINKKLEETLLIKSQVFIVGLMIMAKIR